MKKLIPLLATFALVLAACGDGAGSSTVVATVDGVDITIGDVENLLAEGDRSAIDTTRFSQFLGAAIQFVILDEAALEQFDIDPTEEEIDAEADLLYEQNGQALDQTREEFLDGAGVSEELLRNVARQQLIQSAVEEELAKDVTATEDEIQAARDQAALAFAEVCASHILVETEQEALDILDLLAAGGDFAELATERSLDTESGVDGGDVGCASPARYVETFALASMDAEINVPTDPVETQYGYHILLVRERTEADPADLPSDAEIEQQVLAFSVANVLDEWFTAVMEAAKVVISDGYGTWQTDPDVRVVPPETTPSSAP